MENAVLLLVTVALAALGYFLMNQLGELEKADGDEGENCPLRVAYSVALLSPVVLRALEEVSAEHGPASVRLVAGDNREVLRELQSGRVDVAVMSSVLLGEAAEKAAVCCRPVEGLVGLSVICLDSQREQKVLWRNQEKSPLARELAKKLKNAEKIAAECQKSVIIQ